MKTTITRFAVKIAVASLLVLSVHTISAVAAQGEQGSANGRPFQTLQNQIDILSVELDEAVSLLQDQINTLVAEQADQNTLIAALQSAVATLEARVSQNELDIATLQAIQNLQGQLISALETRVTGLEARVAANENDIAALVQADQALQGLIAAIQGQINVINARITANDGDIAVLQTQVGQLQTQLANVQAQLAAKQNRVNGICAAGSSIRQILTNGNVVCESDDVGAGVGTLSTFRSADTVTVPSSLIFVQFVTNDRYCTGTDYRAVGGGFYLDSSMGAFGHVYRNYPVSDTGWSATVRSDSTGSRSLTTYVICARVQ